MTAGNKRTHASQKEKLFDYFVGGSKQCLWQFNSERLRCPEIDLN